MNFCCQSHTNPRMSTCQNTIAIIGAGLQTEITHSFSPSKALPTLWNADTADRSGWRTKKCWVSLGCTVLLHSRNAQNVVSSIMKRSPSLPRAIARAQVSASPTAVASVSVGCQRRRDNSRRHGAQFTVGNWDGPGHFGIGIIKTVIHLNNINDKLLHVR